MATPGGKMKGTEAIEVVIVWLLLESYDVSAFVHLLDIDVRDAEQHVDDLDKILVRGVSEGSLEVDAVFLEHIDIYIHVLYLMLRIQQKATFQRNKSLG